MSQTLNDAITNASGAEMFKVKIKGKGTFRIPLTEDNAERVKQDRELQKMVAKLGKRQVRNYNFKDYSPAGEDAAKIRAWAEKNGTKVGNRGRLSKTVIENYRKAHGGQ